MVFTSSEPVGDYLDRVLTVENTMMQEEPKVTKYPAYEGRASLNAEQFLSCEPFYQCEDTPGPRVDRSAGWAPTWG